MHNGYYRLTFIKIYALRKTGFYILFLICLLYQLNSFGQDKKTQDKELRKGIYSGKLHFVLHGKKLQGEYALVKTHGRGENAWLLF